jgi:hypothetical protein
MDVSACMSVDVLFSACSVSLLEAQPLQSPRGWEPSILHRTCRDEKPLIPKICFLPYLSSVWLTKSPITIPPSHMRHISSVPGGPCRWLRKTGPARKQKEGSGWEKTWGFSGAVAKYGVGRGETIDGDTPQHRCGEWVERIDDNCAAERERERSNNNKEGDKNRVKCRQCH